MKRLLVVQLKILRQALLSIGRRAPLWGFRLVVVQTWRNLCTSPLERVPFIVP
ncbi:MAG: hypothetical protein OXC42_07685 [Gammaproteobacteria bacterium]|nr:hypothetical protein [Gammaproteobacteria bacterium]